MSCRPALLVIALAFTLRADSTPDARSAETARLLVEGRLLDAAAKCEAAYREASQSGAEDEHLAEAAANLGGLYISLDRFADAERLLKQALEIDRRLLAADAPQTAKHSVTLAKLFAMQNRLGEAGEILARVRPAVERAYAGDFKMMGTLYNDLGLIEEGFGRLKQAATYYRQAIAFYSRGGDSRQGPLAMVMVNLCTVLADGDQLEEAEQMGRLALNLLERAYGPDHPFTARALHSLGRVLQAQNRIEEAREVYERALNKCQFVGELEKASVQGSLGSVYAALGYYPKAELLFNQALATRERVLGPNNSEVVSVLNNIGVLYADQRRWTDAIRVLERGLAINDGAAQNPVVTVPLLMNLACAYYNDGQYRKGRYAQSEALFRRILAIQEARFGPDHAQVANALVNLAMACAAQKNFREAKQIEGRAVAIRQAVLGPQHPETLQAMKQYSFLSHKGQ